jgi:hypothetical protein
VATVTLSPNYIRKLAGSYKLLRSGADADLAVLDTLHAAATRCLNAHMRAELRLTDDVLLPMGTVLSMLQYVQHETAARRYPAPPVPFLARALRTIKQAVGV